MPTLEGIKVTIRDREFVVPSLTYGEKRRLQAEGAFDQKAVHLENVGDDDARVALMALRHNYPELGDDALDAYTPAEIGELATAVVFATLGHKEIPAPGASGPKAEQGGASTSTT